MKKALLLGVMICIVALTDTFAQKHQSLITNDMAHKIAWASQYGKRDFRAHLYGDFCNANEISSSLEYDRIMENITKHKDKVEKFCCLVINKWGDGDFGYAYFKNMDFTVAEFDIVVKIYNQWAEPIRKRQREEEKKKEEEAIRIKKQQAIIDRDSLAKWEKNGKPVFLVGNDNVIAPTFILGIEGYGSADVITPDIQIQTEEPRTRISGKRYSEEITTDEIFYFVVDENRKNNSRNTRYWQLGKDWIWELDLDSTNSLFNYIYNINIVSSGAYSFSSIDSIVNVPTLNSIRIVDTRKVIRDNTTFEIVVVKDKKSKQWRVKQSYEAKELLRWAYRHPRELYIESIEAFLNILTMQINDDMNGVEGKKYRLKIELVGGGDREYYINGYKSEDSNGLPFRTKILNMEKIK